MYSLLRSSFYRDLALSVVFYCLVTVMITWPVVAQLTTGVAGDPNRDNLQFVWNLWWVQEAVVNQQVNPAHVTMLHWPDGGTNQLLSLSVLIPLLALPTTLLGGPVFSYNLWFLLSFPLVGLSGWLLTYYVSGDRRAAFIGGLIFGFFPHKSFHAMGHYLQIMLFLFPLYAIALLRLLRGPSFRQALVTSLILSLCLLVNLVHIGFFLLPMSILLLAHHLWQVAFGSRSNDFSRFGPERLKSLLRIQYLFVMLLMTFVLTSPILWPFLRGTLAGQLDHYKLPGVVSFSSDLLAYVSPSPHHPVLKEVFEGWSGFLLKANLEENVAYMGVTVLLLAGWGVWCYRRAATRWLLMAVVMAVLALGPFLKVGGRIIGEGSGVEIDGVQSWLLMPYAALMQLPFYGWGRIPNRQIMVTMLALSVLAGLGIASLRHKPRRARLLTIVAALLIVFEYLVAFPYPTGSTALVEEPIWRQLREEARGAVLSLPQWDFFSFAPSNEAMFAQTAHGQPIVGAYIHRLPPGSGQTAKAIQELVVPPAERDIVPRLTGEDALRALRALDIATVIVHRDARSAHIWDDADDEMAMSTLSAWAGQPRWANDRFALFDLPDIEVGSEGASNINQAPPGGNCGLRIANCGIKEIRNPKSEIRNSSPPLWSLDAHWQAIEGLPNEARRWMPEQAEVWLWLPDALEDTPLRMDAQSFNGPRTLTISLNSAESSFPLEVWQGAIDQRTLIETPPLTFKKGHNRITLSLQEGCQRPTDIDPQATDGRCLGLLVHHLSLARPISDQ